MAIIGIDLGTSNSLVCVWQDGQSILIPNAFGDFLTPSIVSIDKDTETAYIGKIAKERLVTCPERTASVFKRSMGTKRRYSLGNRAYDSEELSALVLKSLKEDAERYLGEPVTEAIISVPAYFNDYQRSATKHAGELAGLAVNRLINEPSAASLLCKFMGNWEYITVMVFDFGGGTLDVSLAESFDNVINVIAISGDNQLGGSDFDKVLADYFCYQSKLRYDSLFPKVQQSLLQKCEAAKQTLSEQESTTITCFISETLYEISIDLKTFAEISSELFKRISVPIHQIMTDADLSVQDIDEIIMVGGSSKMQIVQQYLRYLFHDKNIHVETPDTSIALGVGIYAGMKERKKDLQDTVLTDICPFSLGTQIINPMDPEEPIMSVIIERNTPLPTTKKNTYSTAADYQKNLLFGVYQGESHYAANNQKLAEFELAVPAKPKGEERVEVTYSYDINGILLIKAKILSTNRIVENIITESSGLSSEEISRKMELLRTIQLPQDELENKLILEKLNRLFAESTGYRRKIFENLLRTFENCLSHNSALRIKRIRKEIEQQIENVSVLLTPQLEAFDIDWYDTIMKQNDSPENTH